MIRPSAPRAILLLVVLASTPHCSLDYGAFQVTTETSSSRGGTGGGTGASGTGGGGTGASGTGGGGTGASSTGGGVGGSAQGGFGAATAGSGPGGGGGGAGPTQVMFAPTVADCTSTVNLSPDTCETLAGTGHMVIDTNLGSFDSTPHHVFLRFDFDGSVQGTVTQATLRLVASNHSFTPGPSGELWQVTTFVRSDLFTTLPTNVGATALGADLGALNQGELAEWTLPPSLITANGSLCLAVRPTSSDALAYWNNNGSTPPVLVVDLN